MCVTWCHKTRVLFWNHDPCSFEFCPLVAEQHGYCASCRHRRGETCALTGAPLPCEQGCCHWNVEPTSGPQEITLRMLAPLGVEPHETVVNVLDSLSTPYQVDPQGNVWVEPARLGLPFTYGLGTEDDLNFETGWDWNDWATLWQEREECAPARMRDEG